MQLFEENRYTFINFKFLHNAISGIIHYIHMLPVNFDYRICSKMKYLCFDLMFLSKINQVNLVPILLFLGFLCDNLSLIPFWSDYLRSRCYFQTSKIITKSIGIIWQKKKMPAKHFANFQINPYIFIFNLPYNIRFFSVTVFSLLPIFIECFKLIENHANENLLIFLWKFKVGKVQVFFVTQPSLFCLKTKKNFSIFD